MSKHSKSKTLKEISLSSDDDWNGHEDSDEGQLSFSMLSVKKEKLGEQKSSKNDKGRYGNYTEKFLQKLICLGFNQRQFVHQILWRFIKKLRENLKTTN